MMLGPMWVSHASHLRFLKREPMLIGILRVANFRRKAPWRFLASLHLGVARQLLTVQWRMRELVWAAANLHLDEVTAGHRHHGAPLFGNQMGARKGYNPNNQGKKSYQPIRTFLAK